MWFWEINNYTKLYTVEGYGVIIPDHMIELADGNIALSSWRIAFHEPSPIIIIDSSTYKIKKEIQLEKYNAKSSSLCLLNEYSFIYAYKGKFLQISSEDGSIMFYSTDGNFNGWNGIVSIEDGEYFAIQNEKKITIVKPCYDD